jgi:hypothetical protein
MFWIGLMAFTFLAGWAHPNWWALTFFGYGGYKYYSTQLNNRNVRF